MDCFVDVGRPIWDTGQVEEEAIRVPIFSIKARQESTNARLCARPRLLLNQLRSKTTQRRNKIGVLANVSRPPSTARLLQNYKAGCESANGGRHDFHETNFGTDRLQ